VSSASIGPAGLLTAKRPREPLPTDFNLTADRCARFQHPVRQPPPWLFVLCLVLEALLIYKLTRDIVDTLLLMMCFYFVPLILLFCLHSLAEKSWYKKQPDRANWEGYQAAKRVYSEDLERWMRMQESSWQSLDGRQFESKLAALLTDLGHLAVATGRSGDGGVDLIVRKRNSERLVIVQCKAHKAVVGPAPVRDLYGTMIHGGQEEAWLVSRSGFSKGAQDFAKGKPIRLFSIIELLRNPELLND
jgi:hypothetical protein